MPRSTRVLALALCWSCTGTIDSSPPGTPGAPGGPLPPIGTTPTAPDRGSAACKTINPGLSPLRRLTRSEYDNTVRDLLGDTAGLGRDFPQEERALGFDNNAESRSVSPLLADRYFNAAETLAKAAVARLPALLACDPGREGDAVCLDRFLDGFGKRAWRRPLEGAEKANLKRAFTEGKTTTFAEGIQAVIQVMLQSPQFLYRFERGVPMAGDVLRLTPYEVASRLSYLLWGSMPDETLLAQADAGKLATREDVLAQAQRMLKDPRAAGMVATFSDQWLRLEDLADLDKEPGSFPLFNDSLRAPFRLETQKLIEKVMWSGDGKLATLLTSPTTFLNGTLAQFYGVPGVTGDAYREVPLDTSKRLGILGHAGLLAVLGVPDDSLTSLVFRGVFVREHLFCEDLPDPPPNAQDENPPFTPTTTAREWSEARQAKANCGACHALIDPIGFGFEAFDGLGTWRATDHGKPIDARGEIKGSDVDGPYSGVVELARKLSTSTKVRDCVATQWFRYGFGRQETADDACTMDTLKRGFAASGGNIRELLIALTQTDAFLYRKGAQP
jgi:hypothetical protein